MWKPKLKTQYLFNNSKENEIIKYELTKTCTGSACWNKENVDEKIKEGLNKWERHWLMVWKTQ